MTDRVTSNKACICCKNHVRQTPDRLYQRDLSAGVNYSVMQYVPLFMSQCGISRVFHIHPGVYLIGNGEVRRPAHQVMVSFIHDIILTERWRCCKHPCLFQYSLPLYGGGEGWGWGAYFVIDCPAKKIENRFNMKENEIITHLKKYPAGDIYYLTSKQYLLRGFEYYQTGRVIYFEWENDMLLVAGVKGQNVYEVYFSINNGRLDFECTCPVWSRQAQCKHVVCALATVKNILDPKVFDTGRQSAEYRRMFSGILVPAESQTPVNNAVSEKETFYSVVLGQKGYSILPEITIEKNNRAVFSIVISGRML